jgi:hypothetical protein
VFVLLSDGSGLTARQSATLLSRAGHRVEALSPDPFCLCRFTRHVRRVHPVPAFGARPFDWLDAAVERYQRIGADVLLPTQEQVAVLSRDADRLAASGVRTIAPSFEALARVLDKVSASTTLRGLGLPQPLTWVIEGSASLAGWDEFPVYLKSPIGTATSGVRLVTTRDELPNEADWAGIAQRVVSGPLVMVQSVFDDGRLVAHHAAIRTRQGARGSASHKHSIEPPALISALGEGLRWHGALSADVILAADGPVIVDVNPRLVEPVNAYRSGTDLVTPLLDLATNRSPRRQPSGTAGVATHQTLMAVLGAAERGRRAVATEVVSALLHRGDYRGSSEELTPSRTDPLAALPIAIAAAHALARPSTAQRLASGGVDGYALTPDGWRQILNRDRRTFG